MEDIDPLPLRDGSRSVLAWGMLRVLDPRIAVDVARAIDEDARGCDLNKGEDARRGAFDEPGAPLHAQALGNLEVDEQEADLVSLSRNKP